MQLISMRPASHPFWHETFIACTSVCLRLFRFLDARELLSTLKGLSIAKMEIY